MKDSMRRAHTNGKPSITQAFDETAIYPALKAAIKALLLGRQMADSLNVPIWQFAEEIESLRANGIFNAEIRWLIQNGLVLHAEEISLSKDKARRFRKIGRLTLSARTCLVLSDAGQSWAERLGTFSAEPSGPNGFHKENGVARPRWCKDLRELQVGTHIVKRFLRPAPNQETVLAAFEEEAWPIRIDDPLPREHERDAAQCLHDTINHLNRNQIHPLIHFSGDGTGRGIRWRPKNVDSSHWFEVSN